ncbi:MAG: (2Fe-2S)-binding protein [Chloroflexi bacterium]|nr:MAG: (2Fe-2S)-binding protein [Chloroflexota bacterium]TME18829.1 MAG: (2Fe-2S)-binding protein [Chloroflexota bacterium]
MEQSLRVKVNGQAVKREVPPRLTLADFLRDRLRLTGTHLGCEHGVCGACTVLLDGDAVRACLLLAVQADGREVTTVEGMGEPGRLTPLQRAFLEHGAFQCGFCTPGFLATGEALLRSGRRLSRAELPDLLAGNLCRCTGYGPIVDAILEAAGSR